VTLFGRYGYQLKGRAAFDRALTIGAELGGSYWGRAADAIGLAVGLLRTSGEFRSATGASGSERIGEFYYRLRVNERFDLSPNLQWIGRPAGDATAPRLTVAGLRAKVGF
jgi:carbohydrate-selective porin OprB